MTSDRTTSGLAVFAALAATFDLLHDPLDQWAQTGWQAANKGRYGRHRVYRDNVPVTRDPGRAQAGEPTMTASGLGRSAASRHVAVYSAGQLAGAVAVTRALGYRLPWRAVLAGAAINAATHWILDRRRPLTAVARAAGKGGYLDTATVVRTAAGGVDATGPGTAAFELDKAAHRGIGLLAATVTAWLATRASNGTKRGRHGCLTPENPAPTPPARLPRRRATR